MQRQTADNSNMPCGRTLTSKPFHAGIEFSTCEYTSEAPKLLVSITVTRTDSGAIKPNSK